MALADSILDIVTNSGRLEATVPVIDQILEAFHCPSFSVGVLHKNCTIFTRGFGFSDKKARRVPDVETIYCLGSCTKAFTAVALVLFSEQGRIRLEAPICESLSEFKTSYNPDVGLNATILDILSHSTGLAPMLYAVMGKNGSILSQREDVIHVCSKLACVAPLRSEWQYNNWFYALAACLMDTKCEAAWSTCVQAILAKLTLSRTYIYPPDDDNVARGYTIFGNGSAADRLLPSLKAGDAFDGSGSIRSCVKDMLTWCQTLIAASQIAAPIEEDDFEVVSPTVLETPEKLEMHNLMKAMRIIQQPRMPLASDPLQSYALGLFRFQLPTHEINSVTNAPEVTKSYVLGASSAPRAVVGHTGDLGSFTNVYWTFPETQSAVVVMTNASSADGDPSNIVAQVLTQALFDLTPAIDLLSVAKQASAAARNRWQNTVDAWNANRHEGTVYKDLNAYTGLYTSTDLLMTLCIRTFSEPCSHTTPQLQLCIDGVPDQRFELYHYHSDTWSFLPDSRDECLALGLGMYISSWRAFNIEFNRFAVNRFCGILWTLDLDPRAGSQVFSRVGP